MTSQPFDNEPSSIDEMTHTELRLMHKSATTAVLFAKNIQWRMVGGCLLAFAALVSLTVFKHADEGLIHFVLGLIIIVSCGGIFVLVMYQIWQFNEISRIREIEKQFSTLYKKIDATKSRREANYHRYTLLLIMISIVIIGAVVANVAINA